MRHATGHIQEQNEKEAKIETKRLKRNKSGAFKYEQNITLQGRELTVISWAAIQA